MDLEKFYFTYGSDDVQPYCGGWTEVWAPNPRWRVRHSGQCIPTAFPIS